MSKTIVIVGANRGIGLEFCKQYLASGEKVYGCCRSPESAEELLALKQSHGEKLEIVPLDVTNKALVNNLRFVIEESVDLLIHNAGIYGPRDVEYSLVNEDEWMDVLKVNSIAPLMVIQSLIDKIDQGGDKKIILLSSQMASIEDNQKGGSYIYRSSKAALNAIGKSLAIDLKAQGITLGMLHPGWVQTDMGGPRASIDVNTSVSGMRKVISEISLEGSGNFLNFDGKPIPW